jgi:son of sevenless-like protein
VPSNAYQLAVALTTLEGNKFSAIFPGECVAYLRNRWDMETAGPYDNPAALEAALATNKRISNWVKKSVLVCDHVEDRIDRLKFMCNTANVCCS